MKFVSVAKKLKEIREKIEGKMRKLNTEQKDEHFLLVFSVLDMLLT